MVPLTRRCLLHGAVGLLTALAGCGRSLDGSSTKTASVPRDDSDGEVPDHYMLRNSSDEPPVLLPREEDAQGGETTEKSPTAGRPENAQRRGFVATEDAAARLWIDDVDGADDARNFMRNTDFDAETLYVEIQLVRECHTLELCSVTWSHAEIDTHYGSNYRDVDVSCRADVKTMISTLIRIPEALDPENVRNHGSGWSSSGCRGRRRPEDDTTTETPEFGPKSATETMEGETTETTETTETSAATETTEAER